MNNLIIFILGINMSYECLNSLDVLMKDKILNISPAYITRDES